jgi:hypothetical protein
MTLFLTMREKPVGGAVIDPLLVSGDGTAQPLSLKAISWPGAAALLRGKNLLFVAHGFNVGLTAGACTLHNLDTQLRSANVLGPQDEHIGILWPGDFWLPVVNYPFEGSVAIDCGRRIADVCNRWLGSAQSLSFVSHSLGARVVLEAVANLNRQAHVVCLTAAAINRNCLATEYAAALSNSRSISVLSSHRDSVLRLAFPVGDPISDLLHPDHTPFQLALGYDGPPLPADPPVKPPWQIPDDADYGHGDYLPPGNGPTPHPSPTAKWPLVADFIGRAFEGAPQPWP